MSARVAGDRDSVLPSFDGEAITFRSMLEWLQQEAAHVDLDAPIALRIVEDDGRSSRLGWLVRADHVEPGSTNFDYADRDLKVRGLTSHGRTYFVLDAVDVSDVSRTTRAPAVGDDDRHPGHRVVVDGDSVSVVVGDPDARTPVAGGSSRVAAGAPEQVVVRDDTSFSAPYSIYDGEPPREAVAAAVGQARSSTCMKSRRGAAVFEVDVESGGLVVVPDPSRVAVVGRGHNGLPVGLAPCRGDDACRAACRYRAVHAEERAVNHAILYHAESFFGTSEFVDVVHAKVDDAGALVAGGGPSCWQCARTMLESGVVAGVWLFEDSGDAGARWVRHEILEFYELTMRDARVP